MKTNYSKTNNDDIKIKLELSDDNQELFGDIAKNLAEKIAKEGNSQTNKSTQIRKFYDAVLKLNQKAQNIRESEYKTKVYPFVVMLKSKVAHARARKLVSETFEKMINICVVQANTKEKMKLFKLFFEAFIGFYKK